MTDWISCWPGQNIHNERAPILLCIPPAGAGCYQFRTWIPYLGTVAELWGVQLPGRENRWREPMPKNFTTAIDCIQEELSGKLPPNRPLLIFGHSFGGLIGYEIARHIPTETLIISSCRAPAYWHGPEGGITQKANELDALFDTANMQLDEESRAFLIQTLRHDAQLSASYQHTHCTPLTVPLQVWHATSDSIVTATEAYAWRESTNAAFKYREIEGDHHSIVRTPEALLTELLQLSSSFCR